MRLVPIVLALLLSMPAFAATSPVPPATTNNDDSCDIAVQPAATLLLPYFQVDFKSPPSTAVTTLFTVQNVSPYPQIAQVTLWTDWGYPAFGFPLFLTGYDVQGINLYDLFTQGRVAPGPPDGTSYNTPVPTNPTQGSQPFTNSANPNFLPGAPAACSGLVGVLPPAFLADLQLMFTVGKGSGAGLPCNTPVGGVHAWAIGYATIDVVATCSYRSGALADYFKSVLLFDNVLLGDYQLLVPRAEKSYALGGPLVHIRAIPEGGPAGAITASSLPYTFYDLYTAALPARTADRRQPLPSTFAARYIQGGTGAFNSAFKIWREGLTAGSCTTGTNGISRNSYLTFAELIRFDEHENATVVYGNCCIGTPPPPPGTTVTMMSPSSSYYFPPSSTSGDVAGWLYMNLNNGGSTEYSVANGRDFHTNTSTGIGVRQSQNWVITSMFAEPTYAVEATAGSLGNGCSPSPRSGAQVGPAANPTP